MIRIGVAGLKKDLIEKTIIENGNGNFEVLVTTDMDAAKKSKRESLTTISEPATAEEELRSPSL